MFSPPLFRSKASHAVIDTDTNEYLPCRKIFICVELKISEYVLFVVTTRCFSGREAVKSGCCFNAIEIYSIQIGEQGVMLWE